VSSDLEQIHSYIAKDSPRNAANFISELLKAIDSLELFPHRYPVHAGRRQPSEAVRRMPVVPYLIYYRVNDNARAVDVVTIRHGKRRQPRRF
jgi:plasmid stabilization system protein ParE